MRATRRLLLLKVWGGVGVPFLEGSTCLPNHLSQVWGSRGQGQAPLRPLPPPQLRGPKAQWLGLLGRVSTWLLGSLLHLEEAWTAG